jgi:Cu/Ag efflux protein CusF
VKTFIYFGCVALITTVLPGCSKSSDDAKDKTYHVQGKVVAVDADNKKITLDHEDIPGLMRAMKMPFAVDNAKVLEGLKPGDMVEGKLKVKSGEYVILELNKR